MLFMQGKEVMTSVHFLWKDTRYGRTPTKEDLQEMGELIILIESCKSYQNMKISPSKSQQKYSILMKFVALWYFFFIFMHFLTHFGLKLTRFPPRKVRFNGDFFSRMADNSQKFVSLKY